jgi:type II secretory pathway component GspD/PulD (secretin)
MRKTGMRIGLLALGLSALLASFAPQVKAQNEDENKAQIYTVPIKNVRAEVMAVWVTPRKDVSPAPFKSDKNGGIEGVAVNQMFEFPEVESITADAAKNELIVKGTPEAVRKLKEIVAFLDKPIRSVEIKAQFVQVDESEMAGLGIDLQLAVGKRKSVFQNDFRDKLKALIATNRAGVLQAAQVTALNNLTATVSWSDYPTLPPTELQITPTIQNDDTVTMFLSPRFNRSTASFGETANVFAATVANVKNADVIVLPAKQTGINGRAIFLLVSAQVVQDKIALLD